MSLTYDTYVSQLANLMVTSSADDNFTTFLPGCIDYAEQRLYRELDILNSRTVDKTTFFSSGSRNFPIPTTYGTFVTVEQINAISTGSSTRFPMVPVTKEFIDSVYPSSTTTGTPAYFATITSTYYLVGPAPDAAYGAEVIGTIRPTTLTSANSSTFLTQYCPDLFIAASMVFATGYQRDFGAQTDDPKYAMTWESQYQSLMASAQAEQLRAKFQGSAWTPMAPSPGPPPRA